MTYLRIGVHNSAVGLRAADRLAEDIHDAHADLRTEVCPVALTPEHTPAGDVCAPDASLTISESLRSGLREGAYDVACLDVRECRRPLPDDLLICAFRPRLNPRYALLHRQGTHSSEFPPGIRIAASSALGQAQYARSTPDATWVTLSGDLPTRLHKLHLQQADAVLEPASDLLLLGFDERAFEFVSTDSALPSPGQGAWAVCRLAERDDLENLIGPLDDAKTRLCATTELEFAAKIGLPTGAWVGALARAQTKKLLLDACLVHPKDVAVKRLSTSGPPERNAELVDTLVQMFRSYGVDRPTRTRR